jgi:hypothetical protein
MGRKRSYGTGRLYIKHGAYYGRWRTSDGRRLNRRIGGVRTPGERDGLTAKEAERRFQRLQDAEEPRRGPASPDRPTIGQAADSLRRKLALEGARKSYLEGCESMQRVHIVPRLGSTPLHKIESRDIERLAAAMLALGRSPKTVRNVLTFLHSIFEHAIDLGWCTSNPVRRAARPKRRRRGDANPDLQFLTLPELDAVIRAIPRSPCAASPPPRAEDDAALRRRRPPTC